MKVTDIIVEFLLSKGICDVFGYPGGVICHFIDSTSKYSEINAHLMYHEQAAAFAACGYAQECGRPGVAYATSGPGATNLVTGIANAYYDSIPTIFLTGQVDTYGLKGELKVRQRGFQETDVVSIVSSISKYAKRIDDPNAILYELEKAYYLCTSGNPGPVVLDLPADVQRAEVEFASLEHYQLEMDMCISYDEICSQIIDKIKHSDRACVLVGNGIKQAGVLTEFRQLIKSINIPVVSSMPAIDTLPYDDCDAFGFAGANGHRYANFILGKSDLIISIGSRLDLKQVGNKRESFSPEATIVRIDIDEDNLSYRVHSDDINIYADIKILVPLLLERSKELDRSKFDVWVGVCADIKNKLEGYDDEEYTAFLGEYLEAIPDDVTITADVGQHEVWIAQQIRVKERQSLHMSCGHGAMGYSLPAAIGAYYANKRRVYSFSGDGGIQMNIQELQYLKREHIPVSVIVINNHALGMIRGFQEANFDKNYVQTIENGEYEAPNFSKVAEAYGLQYTQISHVAGISSFRNESEKPEIVELVINEDTILKPNFGTTGNIQDARPYMDREDYEIIMRL